VFQGCSDVVESRVEHAILDAESRRKAAFSSVSEQPRRANLRQTRTSDDHSPRRMGPLYRPVGRLVNRIFVGPQMPAMTLLEWSQSPIRNFTLICVAQSIDQIRLPSCLISIASDYDWLVGHELVWGKWRLNREEYLTTCTVSSSARYSATQKSPM
jgi:hypothetical protein